MAKNGPKKIGDPKKKRGPKKMGGPTGNRNVDGVFFMGKSRTINALQASYIKNIISSAYSNTGGSRKRKVL
jgi:hypothetical protein